MRILIPAIVGSEAIYTVRDPARRAVRMERRELTRILSIFNLNYAFGILYRRGK